MPGQTLPTLNTAQVGTVSTDISSGLAEWSIYYDPESGLAYSMALDRAATLAMPNVVGYRVDLQRDDGALLKNYYSLNFNISGGDLPQTIPNGTVYSGSLWYFIYAPGDPVNFQTDQAARASSCAQLPSSLYPST